MDTAGWKGSSCVLAILCAALVLPGEYFLHAEQEAPRSVFGGSGGAAATRAYSNRGNASMSGRAGGGRRR